MFEHQMYMLRQIFPDLPRRAIDYFYPQYENFNYAEYNSRNLSKFIDTIKIPVEGNPNKHWVPPPELVRLILDNLVKGGLLREVEVGHPPLWINSRYTVFAQPTQMTLFRSIVNFVGYGLPAVLDAYGPSVLQIIPRSDSGEESGTAFVVNERLIVTAKHCVQSAPRLSILGLTAKQLAGSKIIVSESDALDCAAILLPQRAFQGRQFAIWDDCRVLDEVVLLGYPSIPTLIGAQIAEKSTVSTVIRGAIAGNVSDIFRTDLLLISSPARGGFSGGPILTKIGGVGGMTLRAPVGETSEAHRYDSAGYSFAIPSATIAKFLERLQDRNGSDYKERDPSTFEWVDA